MLLSYAHKKASSHTHLNCHLIFLVQFEVLKYKHAHTKYFIYYYNNINWNKKCQFQEMKYLWLVNQLLTNIFQEKGTVIISFFYSLWKKGRLKVDFSPISWKKHHSTLKMDTFKGMLLPSYLTPLDNKPCTCL